MGYKVKKSTLPTGKDDALASATPKSEPAQTIWYSGKFSAKYLSEVRALGQN